MPTLIKYTLLAIFILSNDNYSKVLILSEHTEIRGTLSFWGPKIHYKGSLSILGTFPVSLNGHDLYFGNYLH